MFPTSFRFISHIHPIEPIKMVFVISKCQVNVYRIQATNLVFYCSFKSRRPIGERINLSELSEISVLKFKWFKHRTRFAMIELSNLVLEKP